MGEKKVIITISREFGSGGHSIAMEVAKRLNIPYYDKELIKQVALKTGLDSNFIEQMGEYSTTSIFDFFNSYGARNDLMNGMNVNDFLWVMQRQVILDLAKQGSCVIVGRCADYILRDDPDAYHFFVRADEDFKAERIVRLYGESDKPVGERIKEKDGKRAANYKHFTGRKWGMCECYDMSFNTAKLGIDRVVELILEAIK